MNAMSPPARIGMPWYTYRADGRVYLGLPTAPCAASKLDSVPISRYEKMSNADREAWATSGCREALKMSISAPHDDTITIIHIGTIPGHLLTGHSSLAAASGIGIVYLVRQHQPADPEAIEYLDIVFPDIPADPNPLTLRIPAGAAGNATSPVPAAQLLLQWLKGQSSDTTEHLTNDMVATLHIGLASVTLAPPTEDTP